MDNNTPTSIEDEATKPEPVLTNRELVFGTNRADFADDDRWADPNDPLDHGETEARFRWLHGPMCLLLALLLVTVACGGELPPEPMTSAATLAPCDPYLVGGDEKCNPAPDGTAAQVVCHTYPYRPDGSYAGSNAVTGCTLDFLASPGVPYTAECVAVCP